MGWADGMGRIADQTGAYCKVSALITGADADWTADDPRPYVDHVRAVFGPARVMWGSDWPVCRLRDEYADWRAVALALTAGLTDADKARVFGDTAGAYYRL